MFHRSLLLFAALLLSLSATAAENAVPPEPLPGALTEWKVGPAGRPNTIGLEAYLDGRKPTDLDWRPAHAGADGWVEIAQTRGPAREGGTKVWARTTLTSAAAETRPLALECLGELSLYLNGRPVLRLNHRSGAGTGPASADTVFLPLAAGENELAVIVTADATPAWRFRVRDATAIRQDAALTTVWEQHDAAFGGPEAVAYDAKRGALYVSRFDAGGILRVSLDDRTVKHDWCPGLQRPTGLKLYDDRLYAIDRSGVVAIDPNSGAIVSRTAIEGAVFANDLAFAADGSIYISDTFKSCIHRVAHGRSEVWYAGPEVKNPNGILVEKDRVLVGVTADSTIKAIDLTTKQVTTFVQISAGANMDGLVSDGGSGYLFSDYYGRLYHVDAAGKLELLLDRRGPQQFMADFEYVSSERLLIIPSLYDQRITALRWTPSPAAKE